MFYGKLLSIFLQGFLVGSGPCLLICAPILLPYIAGTKRTWQDGLRTVFIFGLARLSVYTVLGGVVGYVGYYLFRIFYSQIWGRLIWSAAGLFIIVLGILIISGRGDQNPLCRLGSKDIAALGILVGLSPCLPLMAVLTEIMFLSEYLYQGFTYGFAFGIGTVISPLLLVGALAPLVPAKLLRAEKAQKVFNFVCGILLIGVGMYLVSRV